MQELNRKQRILKLIVEEFVKTAEPVGSHSLIDKYNLPYSSATLRSEMAELENLGYLEKTHTSSGRVPSPRGYRYSVDTLREKNCIDDDTKEKIHALFSQKDIQINEVIKHGCEIISQMTNLTSVMLGPDSNEESLSKVQLMPLTSTSAVALFVTDRGHVEHKIFSIPDSVAMNDLENCVEILNDRISGTKISQVIDKVNSIKPILADAVKQHEVIFRAFLEAFLKFTAERVSVFGRANILEQPEFTSNLNKLRKLVNLLENQDVWRQFDSNDDICVMIGDENTIAEIDDLSVVSANIHFDKNNNGKIALIGPTRMDYSKVIGALEYLQEAIDEYFKESEDDKDE
ncbi:MAG: heat-inducible transcriptional repressor HrcA [Erysipelotrichales bacterium]|nr:heat-inducible transcriptional repressor HrcA [Erysipelotrichales bacterium]